MADALKQHFNADTVRGIAADIKRVFKEFDDRGFVRDAIRGLEALELTPRGGHVAAAMRKHLPSHVPDALRVLTRSLGPVHGESGLTGMAVFRYLPHAAFIRQYAIDHFDDAMAAQHALTQRFTAEWSIRPFLEALPDRTLAQLHHWASDASEHVRRLVSEGTRPRLPWASQLKAFIADPTPVLELLERLKDDPALYVRRSVANNLNDIAKDHPERVLEVAKRWLTDATEERRWIVSHALRSLVKRGHPQAMTLMGAGAVPKVRVSDVTVAPRRVVIGGKLRFSFRLASASRETQDLLVDFAVFFVKADKTRKPKVFKLRRLSLAPKESVVLSGLVNLMPLTTRKPYPGRHAIEARINGKAFHLTEFDVRAR